MSMLLLFAMASVMEANTSDFCSNIAVVANVVNRNAPNLNIDFTITNSNSRNVEFLQSEMPWANAYLAVEVIDGRCFAEGRKPARVLLTGSWLYKVYDIGPGQTAIGVLPVGSRFQDVETLAKECDVVLVWSYVPAPLGEKACPRVSGAITLGPDSLGNAKSESAESRDPH